MTNLEMLIWGISHIAENHDLYCDTNYEEEGEVCIYGDCNVPTLNDVRMLCEDLGIDEYNIDSADYCIDIYLDRSWLNETANKEYIKGEELWKRNER